MQLTLRLGVTDGSRVDGDPLPNPSHKLAIGADRQHPGPAINVVASRAGDRFPARGAAQKAPDRSL
jgi:hypothetical protein